MPHNVTQTCIQCSMRNNTRHYIKVSPTVTEMTSMIIHGAIHSAFLLADAEICRPFVTKHQPIRAPTLKMELN